jgi:hypothetical protein
MTKVYLSYNPFTVKTEITVNDEKISSTSTLYRYRNTPMQDWVDTFLPDLVEHCNDDEISITFQGLQFNFDDLEEQIEVYTKKNRDIEVKLEHEVSKSQVGRIGALSSIIDEIQNNQQLVPELKTESIRHQIEDTFNANLEIVVISANDKLKVNFINNLIGKVVLKEENDKGIKIVDNDRAKGFTRLQSEDDFDVFEGNLAFVNSKYASLIITDTPNSETQEDSYYRYIKKAITAIEKPIILFVLDSISSNNNEEFLNLISEQFKQKGKQNKQRFIFVAEKPNTAKKMLYSDYTINNAQIFKLEEIQEVQYKVKEYMEEYCLVDKIRNTFEVFQNTFNNMKTQFDDTYESNKIVEDNLEQLFLEIKQSLHETDYRSDNSIIVETIKSETRKLVNNLENEFNSIIVKRNSSLRTLGFIFNGVSISSEDVKNNIKHFIENSLKKQIRNYINEKINEIIKGSKCEVIFSNSLISLLKGIDIEDSILPYLHNSFGKTLSNHEETELINEKLHATLKDIDNIEIKRKTSGLFQALKIYSSNGIGGNFSSNVNSDGVVTYKYYAGLLELTTGVLSTDSIYLETSHIEDCKKIFKRNISKIEPIIIQSLTSVMSMMNTNLSVLENTRIKIIDEILEKVDLKIKELKKQTKISEYEQQRLHYIDKLIQSLSNVIRL